MYICLSRLNIFGTFLKLDGEGKKERCQGAKIVLNKNEFLI